VILTKSVLEVAGSLIIVKIAGLMRAINVKIAANVPRSGTR
jgi:hypothetical protein